MRLFPKSSEDKTRFLSPVKFSFGFLSVVLLINGSILLAFVWTIDFSTDSSTIISTLSFQPVYLAVSAIFIITLAAWMSVILRFRSFYQYLLTTDAERKTAEDALKSSESTIRELIENASDLIFTTDLRGNFTSLNKAGEILTGYSRAEAIQLNIADVIAPEFLELVRKTTADNITNVSASRYELEIITKNNERVVVELSSRLIFKEGKPIGVQGIARDITDRRRDEESIRKSEQLYRFLSEGIVHQLWTANSFGKRDYVNERATKYFGSSNPKILEESWRKFVHPEDLEECTRKWNHSLKTGQYYENRVRLRRFDGEYLWHIVRAMPGRDENGQITKWFGTNSDVDEQIKADIALRESETRYRTLLENMGEGLLQVNNDSAIEFVNNRFCQMTGYSMVELLGSQVSDVLYDAKDVEMLNARDERLREGISENYELGLKKKSGDLLWVLVGGAPTFDDNGIIIGSMGVFTDITERKLAEGKLIHDAFHDGLTGLANRALFTDHLRLRVERGKRERNSYFGVLFLDFDRFKVINDSLGHAEGDKLLIAVSKRLESTLRSSDLIARLGGDEFTLLLNELDDANHAGKIASRIQEILSVPFSLESGDVYMSASIGIAIGIDGTTSAEEMLRNADIAMYRAKSKGKAQHQVFDQAMHDEASRMLEVETDLRQALGRNEFCMHYQPIFNLSSKSIVGFEALVRWKHPIRGLVPPNEFIPIAEDNGIIVPLGRWILFESSRQMRSWLDNFPAAQNLTMSVNLSVKQFLKSDLAEQVMASLLATRLDPKHLKLEITESHVMENGEAAVAMMKRLRAIGVELSLDDFGTGYSSLSYLHRLPVSNLKIDRSFVNQMVVGDENSKLVNTIISLAHNLNINVTAEGIETADQLRQLRDFNCEMGQGYFFSKPLEADAATELIKSIAIAPIQPVSNVEPRESNLDLIG